MDYVEELISNLIFMDNPGDNDGYSYACIRKDDATQAILTELITTLQKEYSNVTADYNIDRSEANGQDSHVYDIVCTRKDGTKQYSMVVIP